jgi:hypothetical protein
MPNDEKASTMVIQLFDLAGSPFTIVCFYELNFSFVTKETAEGLFR